MLSNNTKAIIAKITNDPDPEIQRLLQHERDNFAEAFKSLGKLDPRDGKDCVAVLSFFMGYVQSIAVACLADGHDWECVDTNLKQRGIFGVVLLSENCPEEHLRVFEASLLCVVESSIEKFGQLSDIIEGKKHSDN